MRARFTRVAAAALVFLWLAGLIILSVTYLAGGHDGWGLIIVALGAPLTWTLFQYAVGKDSAP